MKACCKCSHRARMPVEITSGDLFRSAREITTMTADDS
jgi:hypothetical protein